jgi:sugar lactone lactonase YvrE
LWFTESAANNVARITTSGIITEYPIPTSGSVPSEIAAGPDGYLWVTEYQGNKVAKVSTGGTIHVTPPGVVNEYTIPTTNARPSGIAPGADGNVWFIEYGANKVGRVTTLGVITEYSIPTANNVPYLIAAGPDGNLWFTESGKLGRVTTGGAITDYPIPTANGVPQAITAGPDGNVWFTERAANKVAKVSVGPNCTAVGVPNTKTAVSTKQYRLASSDGLTWQDIDSTNLRLVCSTGANQATLLTANADLWTANAGYNQDIGIFVSDNLGVDQLVAWKESGGSAGTFSPNAAYLQAAYIMLSGHSYLFKLKWKTNINAPGATIYAAAGSAPVFSPTTLVAETFPSGPNFVVSTTQYTLANSNGATWQTIDASNLSTTLIPNVDATAVLGANADLWTANAGYNQDLGIFVSDNGGADQLVAWKESGGFAGTYSPNAAFVKATYAMTGGHAYVFTLKWKTNINAPGAKIFAAAGSGLGYSPTSLFARTIRGGLNLYSTVSTGQYTLPNSDGATWQPIDTTNLSTALLANADGFASLGANSDLWTANAGFNQDLGIFVSDNGGADQLVAWKESGGFAGTYSPNAAFVQATYPITNGHTYMFNLKWKTNKYAYGTTIFAAAGGPAPYSATRLTVELTA